jgi:hypothetical protein
MNDQKKELEVITYLSRDPYIKMNDKRNRAPYDHFRMKGSYYRDD